MDTLPAVAQNVAYECKKCGQERFHRVLAHVGPDKAKLECEVCHSKKTMSLKKKTQKAGSKGKRVRSSVQKSDENQKRYVELSERLHKADAIPYKMSDAYPVDTKIDHPTFGMGFVVTSRPSQIEVVFADSLRSLVQNRK